MNSQSQSSSAMDAVAPVIESCASASRHFGEAVDLMTAGQLADAWTVTLAAANQCWASATGLVDRFLPFLG